MKTLRRAATLALWAVGWTAGLGPAPDASAQAMGAAAGIPPGVCANPSKEVDDYPSLETVTDDQYGAARGCRVGRWFMCEPTSAEEVANPGQCWWQAAGSTILGGMRTAALTMPEYLSCGGRCDEATGISWLTQLTAVLGVLLITLAGARALLSPKQLEGNAISAMAMPTVRAIAAVVMIGVIPGIAFWAWSLLGWTTASGAWLGTEMAETIGATANDAIRTESDHLGGGWRRTVAAMDGFAYHVATITGTMLGVAVTWMPDLTSLKPGNMLDRFIDLVRDVIYGQSAIYLTVLKLALSSLLAMTAFTTIVTFVVSMAEAIVFAAFAIGLMPLFMLGILFPRLRLLGQPFRLAAHAALLMLCTGVCIAIAGFIMAAGMRTFMAAAIDPGVLAGGADSLAAACGHLGAAVRAGGDLREMFGTYTQLVGCIDPEDADRTAATINNVRSGWVGGAIMLIVAQYAAVAVLKFAGAAATEISSTSLGGARAAEKVAAASKQMTGGARAVVTKLTAKLT